MKRIEREVLAALYSVGPKANAAAIYEAIARGRINPMTFAAFYTILDRLARDPDEATRTVNEMTVRNRRVFWLTKTGMKAIEKDNAL